MTATATRSPVDTPVAAGERLARGYEVIAHLRRGRDLDVYDVWSQERDCRCVAKAPRPDRRASTSTRRRLRHEGRLLLSLAHPHIVRAYELIERPDGYYVVDGRHRVSVARAASQHDIDAWTIPAGHVPCARPAERPKNQGASTQSLACCRAIASAGNDLTMTTIRRGCDRGHGPRIAR